MSVPDNPFDNTDRDPGSPVPRLQLHPDDTVTHQAASPSEASPPGPSHGSLLIPGAHGTKTPRRVQWTSDSHIVSMMPVERNEELSPAQTLDAANLAQVDDALERHRSTRHRPSSLSIASSANDEDGHHHYHHGTHREEEDYDYRLDTDPPRAPTQPLDKALSPGSAAAIEEGRPPEAILDNGVNEVATQYIPLGETDGLPSMPAQDNGTDMDAAKDLVRAHTSKWGVLRRRVKTANTVRGAFSPRNEGVPSSGPIVRDEEKQMEEPSGPGGANPSLNTGMNGMPAIPGGTSVLSSLLALYGQQQGMNSGTTTPASSRPPSMYGSDDEDWDDDESRRRMSTYSTKSDQQGRHGGWLHRKSHSHSQSDSAQPSPVAADNEVNIVNERTGDVEQSTDHGRTFTTHHRSKSTTSIADREPPSPGLLGSFHRAMGHFREDRPKAARSGAGVFGALIQGTGNITGAATPAASTLVPAAKRPGYTLSRYSLPAPSTEEQTPQGPWRPASRPASRPQSRAGSRPPSVHSSTAVDDSPTSRDDLSIKPTLTQSTLTHTKSNDDIVSMKKKKKPLGPLNLKSLERLPGNAIREGGQAFKSAEKWIMSAARTPDEKSGGDYFGKPMSEDDRRRREWEAEKRRRKRAKEAKKKQEIFIIQHVAAILARQQFILKLARALMMFGSPSHRLETQIQATAKVLELNCQVVYLPNTMLVSFGDDATHTSETKFLKQATGLDLGKLLATHDLYWNVVHDKISVDDASKELDRLMTTPVYYNTWQTIIIGAICSAFIVVPSFYGSFIDALMCMPLGIILVGVQMIAAKNDMFSNVFEIAVACVISFLSAVFASTGHFCYTALVSGGVVLILPGYIVLCGALELASRNIVAGAVRIGYSVIYSLFLGFGISIGAEIYVKIVKKDVLNPTDYTCSYSHNDTWYQSTPSGYWYYLCVPAYSFALSLRNQQPLFAKELPIMVAIACAGWVTNHFSSLAFPGRSDIVSAIGSFCVGILGNIYGHFSNGASFPVMVTGILFQLPSGLSQGGIFNFAADTTSGSATQYSEGFGVAEQLISVAIGLTVGLFVSAAVTHPFGGGRKRGAGIFSF